MFWKIALPIVAYALVAMLMLFGVLWASNKFTSSTTLIAALGGALIASIGPLVAAALATFTQHRDTDERIRDDASRVALELTRMDYDLRQQALGDGEGKTFLAPAKVYREFYKAFVALRMHDTWPKTIEELGLLNTFSLAARNSKEKTS